MSLVISYKSVTNLALVTASPGESAVGSGEHCPIVVITPSGHGQVGDGVNSFLLIGVIGGLKSCAGHGYKRLAPFLMGGG